MSAPAFEEGLKKVIGVAGLTLAIVNGVNGAGIFTLPGRIGVAGYARHCQRCDPLAAQPAQLAGVGRDAGLRRHRMRIVRIDAVSGKNSLTPIGHEHPCCSRVFYRSRPCGIGRIMGACNPGLRPRAM
jgi:hypothetical protein